MNKKILFLHIPKTGGIALYSSISKSIDKAKSIRFFDGSEENKRLFLSMTELDLQRYHLISGHFTLPFFQKRIRLGYKVITVVRDPIDRELSAYYYVKGWKGHPRHDLVSKMSLEDYITHLEADRFANLQCFLLSGVPEFVPARQSLLKNDILAIPYHKLNEGVKKIEDHFSIVLHPLAQENKTEFRLAVSDIPNNLLDRLRAVTAEDYKIYNYVCKRYAEIFSTNQFS